MQPSQVPEHALETISHPSQSVREIGLGSIAFSFVSVIVSFPITFLI